MKKAFCTFLTVLSFICFVSCASNNVYTSDEEFFKKAYTRYKSISLKDFSDGFSHARYKYPDSIPPWDLYDEDQIFGIAENMIALQNPDGGWEKNLDYQRVYNLYQLKNLVESRSKIPEVTYGLIPNKHCSTMDNRNIYSQIKYLVQVYKQIPDKRYIQCAERAFRWILNAQHPSSGGFTGADVYAITMNDDVMADALTALNSFATDSMYSVFSKNLRQQAMQAYEKGLECLLKTQVILTLPDGTKMLTAWAQQYSHETFKPVWAREFEPPAISTAESVKIIQFLMRIQNPSDEVKIAVKAAYEWLFMDGIPIAGKKVIKKEKKAEILGDRYSDYENVMVDDQDAPLLWARFYGLDSSYDVVSGARKEIKGEYPAVNCPVWCDRGCRYTDSFNQISLERRNGYGYTGSWPLKLKKSYESWKSANNIN